MTVTFAQMGFGPTVTESSALPQTDGYVGTFNGLPYHIHPTATPEVWAALEASIDDGNVTVNSYVAPVVTLGEVQARQTEMLYAECQAAITGGFPCSILGSVYTYPSTMTDQANQVSIAQSSAGGLLYCQQGTGEWALVEHSQSQAQQVVASFAAWLNACQSKLAGLIGQLNLPNATIESVQSLTWS